MTVGWPVGVAIRRMGYQIETKGVSEMYHVIINCSMYLEMSTTGYPFLTPKEIIVFP